MTIETERDTAILDALADGPAGLITLGATTGLGWPIVNARLQVMLKQGLVRTMICDPSGFPRMCWERMP